VCCVLCVVCCVLCVVCCVFVCVVSSGSLTVHALFIITDATFQGPEKEVKN